MIIPKEAEIAFRHMIDCSLLLFLLADFAAFVTGDTLLGWLCIFCGFVLFYPVIVGLFEIREKQRK